MASRKKTGSTGKSPSRKASGKSSAKAASAAPKSAPAASASKAGAKAGAKATRKSSKKTGKATAASVAARSGPGGSRRAGSKGRGGKRAGSAATAVTGGLRDGAARIVAGGDRIREGVRDLAVSAMDGVTASAEAMRSVVEEIMAGASSVVAEAMPKDPRSPLREVVGGLTEAATTIADGGRRAAKKTVKTTRGAVKGGAAVRDTALRTTQDMLSAVEGFAKSTTGAMRKEIDHLVAEARTTGGRLEAPTRRAATAAAKRPAELVKETAETGLRMALGTTSRLMTAAGGMLSGIGSSLASMGTAGEKRGGGGSTSSASPKRGRKPTVAPKRTGAATRPTAPRSRKT